MKITFYISLFQSTCKKREKKLHFRLVKFSSNLTSARWCKLDHTQPSHCSLVMSLGMSAFQSAEWSTASEVLLT